MYFIYSPVYPFKVYKSVVLSTFMEFSNHLNKFENIFITPGSLAVSLQSAVT